MDRKIERTEQFLIFEYPLRQQLPLLLMAGLMLIASMGIGIVVASSIIGIVTGRAFADGTGTNDIGTLIAAFVVPTFITSVGLLVNFMFPAIHIKSDAFRIHRLFYTSRWIDWREIRDIKSHWLSNALRQVMAITVEGISPLYSFIGVFQLLGDKGFLMVDRIANYPELMRLLRHHRPDLFE